MDWKSLETRLADSAIATLNTLLASEPGLLYAAAFFGSYREAEAIIDMPWFGANSLAALDADHPGWKDEGFSGVKWSPADWRWQWAPAEFGGEQLAACEEALQTFANRGTPAQWDAAEARFVATVTRAAATVRRHFTKNPRVDKDFAVFFHDESGGAALARASLPHGLFVRLFPEQDETEQQRRRLAALPEAEQAAYYLTRLNAYDGIDREEASAWLIAHGQSAMPGLVERLTEREDAWNVAMILGLAGVPDPAAIAALRAQTTSEDEAAWAWSARALGFLGDVDWLLTQPPQIAMTGCCAPLSGFRDDGATPAALDYTPVERLLAMHPSISPEVEVLLEPGSDFCEIRASDVPVATRGLQSPHVVIRRHAACVLNTRRLGKTGSAQAVAALKAVVDDADEQVRYLAGVALAELAR